MEGAAQISGLARTNTGVFLDLQFVACSRCVIVAAGNGEKELSVTLTGEIPGAVTTVNVVVVPMYYKKRQDE